MIGNLTYFDISLIVVPFLFVLIGVCIGATRLALSGLVRFFVGLLAGMAVAACIWPTYLNDIMRLATQYGLPLLAVSIAGIVVPLLIVFVSTYSVLGWVKRKLEGVIAASRPAFVLDRILGVPFGAALSFVVLVLWVIGLHVQSSVPSLTVGSRI